MFDIDPNCDSWICVLEKRMTRSQQWSWNLSRYMTDLSTRSVAPIAVTSSLPNQLKAPNFSITQSAATVETDDDG